MTTNETQKQLSEKPFGYLLAILGGTLGAPIGWIASPIVLLILNNVMKEKDGKQPNRFLVWSLIGIIGVPISLAPIVIIGAANTHKTTINKSNGPQPTSIQQGEYQSKPETQSEPQNQTGVNMENYTRIQTGMSYEEVVAILGKEGEEISSNDIAGYRNIMYKWNGDSGFGANMNAMFQNGKLVQKAQFGLK